MHAPVIARAVDINYMTLPYKEIILQEHLYLLTDLRMIQVEMKRLV